MKGKADKELTSDLRSELTLCGVMMDEISLGRNSESGVFLLCLLITDIFNTTDTQSIMKYFNAET